MMYLSLNLGQTGFMTLIPKHELKLQQFSSHSFSKYTYTHNFLTYQTEALSEWMNENQQN
jgi:hypothetical protein